MKILIIGDIYGEAGKNAVVANLKTIKKELKCDLVIANGENTSIGGKSLIYDDYKLLKAAGIDYFTMGNHTFNNKAINNYIDSVPDLIRPYNWPQKVNGKGFLIFEHNNKKILLINLLGVSFLNINHESAKNPLKAFDQIVDSNKNKYDFIIVDFHAETTAEKIVFGNYVANRAKIFFGTHTHIQTADERIISTDKNKMVYITDIGMCGVFNSAIGANLKEVTDRMLGKKSQKFIEATGPVRMNCLFVELDDNDLNKINYQRLFYDF